MQRWQWTMAGTHLLALMLCALPAAAQEHGSRAVSEHGSHAAPERLGQVTFANSCAPSVQGAFSRAVALLHSFAYEPAEQAFREVARLDPNCAMAHWGIAQTYYHPLWQPPGPNELRKGWQAIEAARRASAAGGRERAFIEATAAYYQNADQSPHAARAQAYERAMAGVARSNPTDAESQIFYALALLATAPPTDKTHVNQKQAAAILEPLYRKYPQHPGLAHYIIHAYDSSALAAQGLAAARAYSQIAPSAPHALHMPSHIFTRMGYWTDSVTSNLAARQAAHDQGDVGEELHAMDYLTYAYLQLDRVADAERIVSELPATTRSLAAEFKVGYAANAMPVRTAIERRQWAQAAALQALPNSAPHVAAIVHWARAVGQARGGKPQAAADDLRNLASCVEQLKAGGNAYWATQTAILGQEARAWVFAAEGNGARAIQTLRAAADQEDSVEKLPVTPGPIVPAREQLGELLLEQKQPAEALREFQASLADSPGRRGALLGAARAAELSGDAALAAQLRGQLPR